MKGFISKVFLLILLIGCSINTTSADVWININPTLANGATSSLVEDATAPNQTANIYKITLASGVGEQTAQWANNFGFGNLSKNDIITVSGYYKCSEDYSGYTPWVKIGKNDWTGALSDPISLPPTKDGGWHEFSAPLLIKTGGTAPIVWFKPVDAVNYSGDFYFNDLHINKSSITVPLDVFNANKTSAFIGDSITHGNPGYGSYPQVISYLLPNWTIYDKGVSGNTPAQMKARWSTDVTALNPDFVFVLGGANAMGNVTQIENNLSTMYDWAISNNSIPVACTMTPWKTWDNNIHTLNTWIREESTRRNIPLVDFYTIMEDPANPGYKLPYNDYDGLHPTDSGYVRMALGINMSYVFNPLPPLYDFYSNTTTGNAPFSTQFKNLDTGNHIWYWDFENDGVIDSTKRNPTHTYGKPGTYSVNLTVQNEYGNFSTVKPDYITVSPGSNKYIHGQFSKFANTIFNTFYRTIFQIATRLI